MTEVEHLLSTEEEDRRRRALLHMLEDLKRERDTAQEARKQWLQTIDAVHDPMVVHDSIGRVLRANVSYARHAGLDIHDILGRPYWECFPRQSLPLTGDEFTTETGEIFVSRSFPIRDADGEARSVLHVFEDVTARRKVQEALERRERWFRTLIEKGSDLILVADGNGRIQYVSPSAETLSGYRPEEVIGRHFSEFLHPGDLAAVESHLGEILRIPGATHAADIRFLGKDGRWLDLAATSRNAVDDPDVRGIVVNARDITQLKENQRKIEKLSQLYGLLSGVNTAIVRTKSAKELFTDVCRVAVQSGRFCAAAVAGYDASRRGLVPMTQYGFDDDEFDQVRNEHIPV
ncbi:MAG: PAS domain S-box protein, partial [Betaproteobacteria bacterium]|nr:PAS domain S-box protein [Betaproteobacteria bacterium]